MEDAEGREMIVPESGGFSVKSEEGKHLGGPYPTKQEAEHRLAQVEAFKHIATKGKPQTQK